MTNVHAFVMKLESSLKIFIILEFGLILVQYFKILAHVLQKQFLLPSCNLSCFLTQSFCSCSSVSFPASPLLFISVILTKAYK